MDEAREAFRRWYEQDTKDDPDFANETADDWLKRAEHAHVTSEFLQLPNSGMSLREYLSLNFIPEASPFPDKRRVGGDHDRGFSPAVNIEMAQRALERGQGAKARLLPSGRGSGPLRPPLKKSS